MDAQSFEFNLVHDNNNDELGTQSSHFIHCTVDREFDSLTLLQILSLNSGTQGETFIKLIFHEGTQAASTVSISIYNPRCNAKEPAEE